MSGMILLVPLYAVTWFGVFRLSRGQWRFTSDGGWDAVDRNVAVITANVALVVLNVFVLVVAKEAGS